MRCSCKINTSQNLTSLSNNISKDGHFYRHVPCLYNSSGNITNTKFPVYKQNFAQVRYQRNNESQQSFFHFSSASKYTRPPWPTSSEWHSDEFSSEGTAEKLFHRREISVSFDTCSTYRSEFRSKSISNFRPAVARAQAQRRIHIRVHARKKNKNIEKGENSFFNFPKKIKMENNRSVGRRATETRSNVPRSFNYPAPSGGAYRSTVERRSWFV